jgi:hypothetical protein
MSTSLSLTIQAEGRHDRSEVAFADRVGVRPLADDTAGGEARLCPLEELAREERGDAGNPGVRRLGNDHVVLLSRQQQVRTTVADDEVRPGVGERVVVFGLEEARGLDDFGGDFDDVGTLDRMAQRRAERDAAAEADNRHPLRRRVKEQRQVRHQLLRQHVAAVRRVGLAVHRQRRRAGEPLH